MRTIIAVTVLVCVAGFGAWAQSTAKPAPDLTKGIYVSAADVAAVAKKAGGRIITLPPYNVGIEYRTSKPDNASIHDTQAELFYIIDGSGTLITGGKLTEPKQNGANWSGTGIEGGTRQRMSKGDFAMVPPGVPHWFTDIEMPITNMAFHLPMPTAQK